jgi:hypothetical protein
MWRAVPEALSLREWQGSSGTKKGTPELGFIYAHEHHPCRKLIKDLDLQPHGTRSRFHVFQSGLRKINVGRIDEHLHRSGHRLAQKFQPSQWLHEIKHGGFARKNAT